MVIIKHTPSPTAWCLPMILRIATGAFPSLHFLAISGAFQAIYLQQVLD